MFQMKDFRLLITALNKIDQYQKGFREICTILLNSYEDREVGSDIDRSFDYFERLFQEFLNTSKDRVRSTSGPRNTLHCNPGRSYEWVLPRYDPWHMHPMATICLVHHEFFCTRCISARAPSRYFIIFYQEYATTLTCLKALKVEVWSNSKLTGFSK